ncbi:tail fiber assembly protein [Pseudomonas syringae]|uniref:tail fiber assembly protein n=1 Tax=Pseudomonas syringae TaxID=317 RepID=UPI003F753206
MDLLTLRITGTSPLMHSDRLANPLLSETKAHKELTSKRKKTDDDHLAIARSEFIAGAYFDDQLVFFIPGQKLKAAADFAIAPLQDAFDIGEATAQETFSLNAWKKYRVLLNRISQQSGYPVSSIDWPKVPI